MKKGSGRTDDDDTSDANNNVPYGVHLLQFFKKGETQRLLIRNEYLENVNKMPEKATEARREEEALYFTVTLKRWVHVEKI